MSLAEAQGRGVEAGSTDEEEGLGTASPRRTWGSW